MGNSPRRLTFLRAVDGTLTTVECDERYSEREHKLEARTIQLKLRYSDFHTITRSVTLADHADTGPVLIAAARGGRRSRDH